MTINQNLETLEGYAVQDWRPGAPVPADTAVRLAVDYGDPAELTAAGLVEQLSRAAGAAEVPALVIGPWAQELFERDPQDVVDALVAARDRFPALRHLFLGDITFEQNEISWIEQCDLGPLVNALTPLETFACRGGNGLDLAGLAHDRLRKLVVQTGGLAGATVRGLGDARLPALEHLELWLGDRNYGGDATGEDLMPILSGRLFPKLRYLGLRDALAADEVARAAANAPVLAQLDTLDLSMGALGDEGAEALLASPLVTRLKRLDLRHNFLSEPVAQRLAALQGPAVDVSERQEPRSYGGGESYRYVQVAE